MRRITRNKVTLVEESSESQLVSRISASKKDFEEEKKEDVHKKQGKITK